LELKLTNAEVNINAANGQSSLVAPDESDSRTSDAMANEKDAKP
jgi:hypothetical protein